MRRQAAASVSISDTDRPPLSPAAASAAVALLAILTYAATLTYGFVWDDPISVQSWLPAIPRFTDAFFPPPKIPQFPSDYYRPLQLLSYRLDYAVGGGAAWPFHLTAVLLHGLATLLVFATGLRFLGRSARGWWAALWAAGLFAVHPIHSESVAWMAARPDVMVTCAGLAALLASWNPTWREPKRAAGAASFVFLGLLCKETAAALLLVMPLSPFILASVRPPVAAGRKYVIGSTVSLGSLLPFIIAAGAYLWLRAAGSYAAVPDTTLPPHLAGALVGAVGTYLRLLIFPFPQNAYIADLPSGVGALAVPTLGLVAFIMLLQWSWRRGDEPLRFALVWIALTLAPSLGVIVQSSTAPMAERYLYLPSVGFCWAFGILVVRAWEAGGAFRRVAQIGAACVIVVAGGATLMRNRIWMDNHSLWSDTAAKNEVDGLPLRSLAAATLANGDPQTAERLFLEALERHNTTRGKYIIYNNLGTIALGRNDDDAAERYYRQAADFEPAPALLYNLGLIRLRRGLDPARTASSRDAALAEARDFFERAAIASPHDAEIHLGLAQSAEALGDTATARLQFERALKLGLPTSTEAAARQRLEGMK